MNIIVVDDHVMAEDTLRAALAPDLETGNQHIAGVRTPEELERVSDLKAFDLAFVDLDFGKASDKSGLYALRVLEVAGVPTVIYAAEDERNRALPLLAAFQFYDPRALVTKAATSSEIRQVVMTIGSGARPESEVMRRYQRPRRGLSIIDRLLIRPSDLKIWRALASQTDRAAIARMVPVSSSKVDAFLKEHYDIVAEINEMYFPHLPIIMVQTENPTKAKAGNKHTHLLPPLHSFAVIHHKFFQDPELERLIKQRGERHLSSPVEQDTARWR